MIERYKQFGFLGSRTFELQESLLVIVIQHRLIGKVEKRINLFDINNQIESRSYYFSLDNVLWSGLLFFALMLAATFFSGLQSFTGVFIILLFSAILLLVNFIGQSHYLEIKTKYEPIILEANRWNARKGRVFLEKVLVQAKVYLRKQYMFVDADIPEDVQFKNYRWLLMNELITTQEYEELKTKLKEAKPE